MKFLTDLISTVATQAFSLYNQINESSIGQGYMGVKNTVRGFLGNAISSLFGLLSGLFTSKSNTVSSDEQSEEVIEPVVKRTASKPVGVQENPNSITYALNYFRQKEAEGKRELQQEELRKAQTSKHKPD